MVRVKKKQSHSRKHQIPFHWPNPPLNIGLVEPRIPQNTGNIARLCAATQSRLHLVEPLGFRITDRDLKRAGLDYWDEVDVEVHESLKAFMPVLPPQRTFLFSTAGERSVYDVAFSAGDYLIFGSETEGLPDDMLSEHPEQVLQVPIVTDHVRSLNLASSVSIVVYEALRQLNEAGAIDFT